MLIARLVLAGVFVVAGVAKLADPRGSRAALRAFGLPAAPLLAVLLPLAELAVAAALVAPATARWGAAAALALLAAFGWAITRALARGEQPECHCFGRVHSAPAGAGTLARNAGLALLAGLVLAGPLWTAATAAALALAGALGFQAWFSLQLLRQNGRVLARLDELALGAPPPPPALEIEERSLLVFTDPGCSPCRALLPELATWRTRIKLVVVSRGPDPAAAALGLETVVQAEGELARAYGANGTPSAVLVEAGGRPAGPVAAGAPAIRQLLEAAASRPAPDFDLPDLDGRRVRLADLRGERVLLLFWNPGCGFCKRMADDLRTFASGVRLVLVAAGGEEANRALGLPATVLLDDDGAAAAKFGARGTPMGVLIDERGRIASELAGGAPAVLALAREPAARAA